MNAQPEPPDNGTIYKIVLHTVNFRQENNFLRNQCSEYSWSVTKPIREPRTRERQIYTRSTKPLRRQVFTGGRQHQLPVLDAPDGDQMLGDTLYNRGLPAHHEHFETVVVIQVHVKGGDNLIQVFVL